MHPWSMPIENAHRRTFRPAACRLGVRPTRPASVRAIVALIALIALVAGVLGAAPAAATPVTVTTEPTFRQALVDLSADGSGPHTITLGDDIVLAQASDPTYTGGQPLTIDGSGHTLDGADNGRVLVGTTTVPLILTNITVTGGRATGLGGAVQWADNMTISDSTITDNHLDGANVQIGGAVGADGTVAVANSIVTDNSAISQTNTALGGAISGAAMTVTDSAFANNSVTAGPGSTANGGAVSVAGAPTLTITRSTFTGNSAAGNAAGGGAISSQTSPISVVASTLTANRAETTATAFGGGIHAAAASVTVTNSSIDGNTAMSASGTANGGGLYASSTATMTNSTLNGNEALGNSTGGGGVRAVGGLTFTGVSATDNRAAGSNALGGAASAGGPSSITDSSLIDNQIEGVPAGGAAVVVSGGDLQLFNSTVAGAAGPQASGVVNNPGGSLELRHTTIAPTNGVVVATIFATELVSEASVIAPGVGPACQTTTAVTSLGYNYDTTGTCGFAGTGDVPGGPDPLLGPPRNNGDLTPSAGVVAKPSMFPLAGSPVIDAIPAGSCSAAPEVDLDQRGVGRPFGSGCDIGSIEAVFPAHGFSDVSPFYEPTVRWATSTANTPQLQLGFGDGTYRPTINITRGQAAFLLHNEAGNPTGFATHGFTDVTPFFENAVRWAKANNVFLGFDDNTFRENDLVTRGQLTRAKYGFAGSQPVAGLNPHGFTDSTPFFENAIRWAKHHGLVNGFPNNTFQPNNPILRGDATRIDYNLAQTRPAWNNPNTAPPNMIFRPNTP